MDKDVHEAVCTVCGTVTAEQKIPLCQRVNKKTRRTKTYLLPIKIVPAINLTVLTVFMDSTGRRAFLILLAKTLPKLSECVVTQLA